MCYALNWLDCVCFRSYWEPVSDLDGRCWTWSLVDLTTLFVTIHRLAQPVCAKLMTSVIHQTKNTLTKDKLFIRTHLSRLMSVEVNIWKNYMKNLTTLWDQNYFISNLPAEHFGTSAEFFPPMSSATRHPEEKWSDCRLNWVLSTLDTADE